jgi:hypothetical protein
VLLGQENLLIKDLRRSGGLMSYGSDQSEDAHGLAQISDFEGSETR